MDGVRVPDAPADPPVVAGYTVNEWLGAGATGQVWRGHDRVTGEAVVIKRLYDVPGLAGCDRLRRVAAVLQVLDHPHVVPLHRLVLTEDDALLVLGLATGGSLADLLDQRGRLTAGELVTIGTPLAQALAAVHARGLVHGVIDARAVLFDAEGRPKWSDLGLAPAIGVAAGLTPADDVVGLGALLRLAAGDAMTEAAAGAATEAALPPRLAAVLDAACDPEPAARPSAGELAVRLYDAAAATPVRLARFALAPAPPDVVVLGPPPTRHLPAAPSPRPPAASTRTPGRRRRTQVTRVRSPRRGRARAAVLALALTTALLLGAGGWRWWWPAADASSTQLPPTPTDPTTPTRTAPATLTHTEPATPTPPARRAAPADVDPVDVLTRLDAQRSAAYATGDAALLRSLYTRASAAGRADLANLARLVAAGERARGFRTEPASVRVLLREPDLMRLAVVDSVPAFDVVRPDDRVVRTEPGRGERTFLITLSRVGDRWLYAAVESAEAPEAA